MGHQVPHARGHHDQVPRDPVDGVVLLSDQVPCSDLPHLTSCVVEEQRSQDPDANLGHLTVLPEELHIRCENRATSLHIK